MKLRMLFCHARIIINYHLNLLGSIHCIESPSLWTANQNELNFRVDELHKNGSIDERVERLRSILSSTGEMERIKKSASASEFSLL